MGGVESKAEAEIGSRNSGPCDLLTTARRETSEQFARRHLGPEFKASDEERVAKNKEARIIFQNRSSYRVSYWVVQEVKKHTTAHRQHILKVMGVEPKIGYGGAAASGNASREGMEAIQMDQEEAYFLMKDHHIEPCPETLTVDVCFPEDCKDLRVYGFFEAEKGEWQLFKDKVYSIAWLRKKITLTALDGSISPYTRDRNCNPNVAVRSVCVCCVVPGMQYVYMLIYELYRARLLILICSV